MQLGIQVWFQGKIWVGDIIVEVFKIIIKALGVYESTRRVNVNLHKL